MRAHQSPLRLRPVPDTTPSGVRELMAVREIVQAFLTAERPADVFQLALDRVSPLVGALLACVYVREDDSELMHLSAAYNWPQRYARFLGEMRVRVGAGPSGRAVAERAVIEVPDLFADPSLADWRSVANELGFCSLVALPLQTDRTVHGAITFYFANPGRPSAEVQHLLQTVADQMAATSEKARLIAELRRSNAALQASNFELERQYASLLDARRVKDEFLANISHELRTPLTAVIGYISLMEEGIGGPITDDQRDTLEQVKDSSEQLLSLISDLLDLTTLKRGSLDVKPCEFDPNGPLRDAVDAASGKSGDVSIDVTGCEADSPMWSDQAKVAKILDVILGNAIKFTKAGSVRARLVIGGGRVRYEIQDTGIGIPAEAQQLIFEEFRQVDGTATRPYGGSGLGLALARRLARLLGGDVSVTSQPGVGSTFVVDLPMTYDGSGAYGASAGTQTPGAVESAVPRTGAVA